MNLAKNRSGFVIFLFLLISAFLKPASGQQTIDTSFPNGRLLNSSGVYMDNFGDSLTAVFFLDLKPNFQEIATLKIFNNSDLSLKSQLIIDTLDPGYERARMAVYGTNGGHVYLSYQANQTYFYSLYKLNSDLSNYSLLFKHQIPNLRIINSKIIDNEVYIQSINSTTAQFDTVLIQVLDFNGVLLRQKYHGTSFSANFDSAFTNTFSVGPMSDPNNSNQIVFGNEYKCRTISLDKQSLEVTGIMQSEPIDIRYGSTYITNYSLFPDRVECGGTVVYGFNFSTNIEFTFQSYFHSRNWQGDSIYEDRFGSLLTDERCYSFYTDPFNQNKFLVGAAPFSNYIFEGQEYREIVLHRFNQFGRDSLLLYGNKNHVPFETNSDSQGNIYILSTYTDSWTTDSSFYTLTKIPNYAISLLDKEKIKELHLYPNPCKDFVNIPSSPNGKIVDVEIYNQTGQLVKKLVAINDQFDIREINSGIYIVKMTDSKARPYVHIIHKI